MILNILGTVFAFIALCILAYLSEIEQEIEYQEQNKFYDSYTKKLLKKEDMLSNLVIIFCLLGIFCIFIELLIL